MVNNDAPNGIDPTRDAGPGDVVGGSLGTGVQIPWATFEQTAANGKLQAFVRAYKAGAWVTEGFPASLNLDPAQDAFAPSIDFAGPNRNIPWVTWYEASSHLPGAVTNIFASRFENNVWIPSGQNRATDGSQTPSLNINPDRIAEDPQVIGGATTAGNPPVPWVTWREEDGAANQPNRRFQIFVSRGVKQSASGSCTGFSPGSGPSVASFCWQSVGIPRVSKTSFSGTGATDPSLNIDVTRTANPPDGAFTGPGDTVPWIVWYEEGPSGAGLRSNDQVFAAKAVPDAAALGGFRFVAVGGGTVGAGSPLDTSGSHNGACAASVAAEDACALNKNPQANGLNPRVTAGSLSPDKPTSPWVVWQEEVSPGINAIFISHLVGEKFELFNNGQPISNTLNDSTRPDVTFVGNVPYVSWLEKVGAQTRAFLGHFEGLTFRLDTPTGLTWTLDDTARPSISSTCTAVPANQDGQACAGGAVGTAFITAVTAGTPHGVVAATYAPAEATTGDPIAVAAASAKVAVAINPGGTPVRYHVEFGGTTAYGALSTAATLPAASARVDGTVDLTGLRPATEYHYRVAVATDLGGIVGADRTFTTAGLTAALVAPKANLLRRAVRRSGILVKARVNAPARVSIVIKKGRKVVIRRQFTTKAAGVFSKRVAYPRAARGKLKLTVVVNVNGARKTLSRIITIR